MAKPKILIFAPREEPKNLIASLEGAGYELAYGERAWQHPRSDPRAISQRRPATPSR